MFELLLRSLWTFFITFVVLTALFLLLVLSDPNEIFQLFRDILRALVVVFFVAIAMGCYYIWKALRGQADASIHEQVRGKSGEAAETSYGHSVRDVEKASERLRAAVGDSADFSYGNADNSVNMEDNQQLIDYFLWTQDYLRAMDAADQAPDTEGQDQELVDRLLRDFRQKHPEVDFGPSENYAIDYTASESKSPGEAFIVMIERTDDDSGRRLQMSITLD